MAARYQTITRRRLHHSGDLSCARATLPVRLQYGFNWKLRRAGLLAVVAAGALVNAAPAQHAPAPRGSADAVISVPAATQPAGAATLPAGHPGIGGMGSGTLPAGHPGIPGAGGGGGAGGLPQGHAPINTAPATGALRVIISQGTPGGPADAKDPVTIELYSRGKVLNTYHAAMDAKGVVELKDLPLEQSFQPVITVLHGGVAQRLVGPSFNKVNSAIEMDMKVYEVTDTPPAWTIGMRYITTELQGLGKVSSLKVVETIGGFNPLDRAWLGKLNSAKEYEIFSLTLPPGATDILFGPGMLEAGAKAADGTIVRPGPMLPGSTEYVFGYTVPVVDGKATLIFTAPADTTLFALYPPVGAKVLKLEGLEKGKSGMPGGNGALILKGRNHKAGALAKVTLTDISYALEPELAVPTTPGGKKPEGHP